MTAQQLIDQIVEALSPLHTGLKEHGQFSNRDTEYVYFEFDVARTQTGNLIRQNLETLPGIHDLITNKHLSVDCTNGILYLIVPQNKENELLNALKDNQEAIQSWKLPVAMSVFNTYAEQVKAARGRAFKPAPLSPPEVIHYYEIIRSVNQEEAQRVEDAMRQLPRID